MIDKIISLFSKRFPNLIVTMILDYSDDFFIIEAVESLDKFYFNDPFYFVRKSDFEILAFSPELDREGFSNSLENKIIYKK